MTDWLIDWVSDWGAGNATHMYNYNFYVEMCAVYIIGKRLSRTTTAIWHLQNAMNGANTIFIDHIHLEVLNMRSFWTIVWTSKCRWSSNERIYTKLEKFLCLVRRHWRHCEKYWNFDRKLENDSIKFNKAILWIQKTITICHLKNTDFFFKYISWTNWIRVYYFSLGLILNFWQWKGSQLIVAQN